MGLAQKESFNELGGVKTGRYCLSPSSSFHDSGFQPKCPEPNSITFLTPACCLLLQWHSFWQVYSEVNCLLNRM